MTIDDAVGAGLDTLAAVAALVRTAARRIQTEIETVAQRLPLGRAADVAGPVAAPLTPGGGPQEQVAETKYDVGARRTRPPADRERSELPRHYGSDRLVLLPRDPRWVFAYWEITPATRLEALRSLGDEADGARDVLRVHDGTLTDVAGHEPVASVDVEFAPGAESWYVNVGRPGATLCAEIGLRAPSGRFVRLTRSNSIRTPPAQPAGPSPVRWATLRPAAGGAGPGVAWSRSAVAEAASDVPDAPPPR